MTTLQYDKDAIPRSNTNSSSYSWGKNSVAFRNRAIGLLFVITLVQASFFLLILPEPIELVLTSLLFTLLSLTVIFSVPRNDASTKFANAYRWLPWIIVLLAIFKLITRWDVYFISFSGGLNAAREFLTDRDTSTGIAQSLINVFLTPLWINLLVQQSTRDNRLTNLQRLAIGIVPFIALGDMMLFGARTVFAFQIAFMFVTGYVKPKAAAIVGLFFVAAFVFVHASRSSDVESLGLAYLTLTASAAALPPQYDLTALGVPDSLTGVLVLGQYFAHPIAELTELIRQSPWWNPSFAVLLDQFAAIGFGNRQESIEWLAQNNPGMGRYQTLLGSFVIDFGVAGIAVAISFLIGMICLIRFTQGHSQRVLMVIFLTVVALAPIENFFVAGGGVQLLLAILLSFILPFMMPRHHQL